MSGGGGGEKTEKATPKKLQDLRKKGQAARSMELPQGVSMMALVLVLPGMVQRLFGALRQDLTLVLGGADVEGVGAGQAFALQTMTDCVRAIAPGVAIVGATALLSGMAVTRSKPNPHALKPQWNRISPKNAVKRMFSAHSAVDLAKNVSKLLLLTAVAFPVCQDGYARLLAAGGDWTQLQSVVGSVAATLLWQVAALALLVGVADAWWQRHSYDKQAKMSMQEIKDEHKQSEGDPHTKGQIRSRMLAASRSRMIQAVPKADVVLANPTHLVVALAYAPGSAAPVVVARGAGAIADRIKAVARENGGPVIADKPLARAIYRATEVGDSIPVELFRAVAEVLAIVYAAKRTGTVPPATRESVLA
ncbi:MAG: Flagellar biosynthesis protein FlhB [Frankiales bacterium]|nr:Flagellar biosynthesis protein FlhB [Frankiales bacterium]